MSQGEILRKSYESIVNGCVAVRMETTENVTDRGSALTVRLIGSESLGEHRIKYPSVNRLHAVSDIREGTVGDNAHRIVDE